LINVFKSIVIIFKIEFGYIFVLFCLDRKLSFPLFQLDLCALFQLFFVASLAQLWAHGNNLVSNKLVAAHLFGQHDASGMIRRRARVQPFLVHRRRGCDLGRYCRGRRGRGRRAAARVRAHVCDRRRFAHLGGQRIKRAHSVASAVGAHCDGRRCGGGGGYHGGVRATAHDWAPRSQQSRIAHDCNRCCIVRGWARCVVRSAIFASRHQRGCGGCGRGGCGRGFNTATAHNGAERARNCFGACSSHNGRLFHRGTKLIVHTSIRARRLDCNARGRRR